MMVGVPARAQIDDLDDEELTRRVADGDAASLGLLYDRHHADVRRFIGRMAVPASDVEDIVQQTFLQVVKAAHRFDGRASLKPWLFGVAAVMVRRHRSAAVRISRRFTSWMSEEPVATGPSAADLLVMKEESLRASAALSRLSAKKREVFVMIVMEGARGDEAAAALGIPLKTVWTRLHHARRELREALKERES